MYSVGRLVSEILLFAAVLCGGSRCLALHPNMGVTLKWSFECTALCLSCAILSYHHQPLLLLSLTLMYFIVFLKLTNRFRKHRNQVHDIAKLVNQRGQRTSSSESRISRVLVSKKSEILYPGQRLFGVCWLGQKMFLMFARAVYIYEMKISLVFETLLMYEEIYVCGDIVASPQHGCLFLLDCSRGVFKINVSQSQSVRANYSFSLWFRMIFGLKTICVTNDGLILLLHQINGVFYMNFYSIDCIRIKSVALPPFVLEPIHILQTPANNFILSYGVSCGLMHGLCKLSETGVLLKIYHPDYSWKEVRKPMHVAVDSDGRVFIADNGKNRIVCLDSNLNFSQILQMPEDVRLFYPYRISLAHTDKQLLICHGGNQVAWLQLNSE